MPGILHLAYLSLGLSVSLQMVGYPPFLKRILFMSIICLLEQKWNFYILFIFPSFGRQVTRERKREREKERRQRQRELSFAVSIPAFLQSMGWVSPHLRAENTTDYVGARVQSFELSLLPPMVCISRNSEAEEGCDSNPHTLLWDADVSAIPPHYSFFGSNNVLLYICINISQFTVS